ncbi:MAG: diphthine--ammonia ligase [Verrucomicrobiota bacterium]|nr:diphthine--ammonia ligase [Verrucomicrobiota bacterium]
MQNDAFFSWSGGKDITLALHRAIKSGYKPRALVAMLHEDGTRNRSHGLRRAVLEAQSISLGIPMLTRNATWGGYREQFLSAIGYLSHSGIKSGVFGDIDLQDHRDWEEKVCAEVGVLPVLPLWKENRRKLMEEFLSSGFKARIVVVRKSKLDESFLGRFLNHGIIDEFEAIGIDPCGEEGEYHTVTVDGPLFQFPLELRSGQTHIIDDCAMLDFEI